MHEKFLKRALPSLVSVWALRLHAIVWYSNVPDPSVNAQKGVGILQISVTAECKAGFSPREMYEVLTSALPSAATLLDHVSPSPGCPPCHLVTSTPHSQKVCCQNSTMREGGLLCYKPPLLRSSLVMAVSSKALLPSSAVKARPSVVEQEDRWQANALVLMPMTASTHVSGFLETVHSGRGPKACCTDE